MGRGCLGVQVRRAFVVLIDEMLISDLVFGSPDRWDDLPEAALALPGLFSNLLTFSAGPRVRLHALVVIFWIKAHTLCLLADHFSLALACVSP